VTVCTLPHIRAPPIAFNIGRVHELSVCQALLAQVAAIAASREGSVVARISVEVGPLAGIEPAQLASAFSILRSGGCAAQAELSIETTRVIIRCTSCGTQSQTRPNRLVCGGCGGFRILVLSGQELRLRRVELHAPAALPACSA
jgi:hydrogenase nickel incorporation protein HypA/HybF